MTPSRLKEIRERLEKATPGPWCTISDLPRYAIVRSYQTEGGQWIKAIVVPSENHHDYFSDEEKGCSFDNAELIAHTPSDIAWLLTELEKCQAGLAIKESKESQFKSTLEETMRVRDRLKAALELAKESLEQIHKKLTPCIPKMDGRDSWQIHQRFIDDVYIKATKAIEQLLEGK